MNASRRSSKTMDRGVGARSSRMKRVACASGIAAAVAAVLFGLPAAAEEGPLAKQGQFSGKFGWWAVGKVYQLGKDQIYWNGEFNGTFFNDSGGGFLHGSSLVCPGYNELRAGVSLASGGRCVVTDMDGDKAFATWDGGQGNVPMKFSGTAQFVGGTGKYAGIQGRWTFQASPVATTEQGFGIFKGEWKLP
jgi:hypothetical protein